MSAEYPYNGLRLEFGHRLITARFEASHLVLSTSRANGGLRDDLTCLCNQQSCEPAGGHCQSMPTSAYKDPEAYQRLIAARHSLPAESLAMLGTAANMHCAHLATELYADMTVVAIATAGVEGNAGRAGDPAAWVETEQGSVKTGSPEKEAGPATQGTINIMVFCNREMTPGAMASAFIMITEAKTSVMQEFSVSSRYSHGLATGTGTDQAAVACKRGTGKPLTNTGKHSKLGELIANAVRRAVMGSLARQNGLTPSSCCSVAHLLARHGGNHETLLRHGQASLSPEMGELFRANFLCVNGDPPTVGYVAALLHIKDQCAWGVIPEACYPDMEMDCLSLISAAVSGDLTAMPTYREKLEAIRQQSVPPPDVARMVATALAVGFDDKWHWE